MPQHAGRGARPGTIEHRTALLGTLPLRSAAWDFAHLTPRHLSLAAASMPRECRLTDEALLEYSEIAPLLCIIRLSRRP